SIDTKAVLASVAGAAATVGTKISTTLRKPGRSRAAEAAEAEAVPADGVGAVAPDAAPGEQAPVAAPAAVAVPAAVTPTDPAASGWSARVVAAGQGVAAFLSGLPQRAAPALAQGQQVVDKVTNVIARRAELAMLPKPSKWRAGLRSLQERVQKTVASESAAMGSQAAEWVNRVDTKGRFGVITRRLAAASASASNDAPAAPVETGSVETGSIGTAAVEAAAIETVSVEARSTAPRVRKPRAAPKRAAAAKADDTANAGVSQAGPAEGAAAVAGAAVAGAAVAATKAAPKRTRAAAPRKVKVQDGSEAAADGANAEAAPPKRVRARKRSEAGADVEA
ncbi:MAG: hypothetical protein ACKOBM_05490, partial [Gammaproteobacteria bacterium]